MKTEFLKELGLSEEQISAVFAENGKDVKKVRDRESATNAELDELKKTLSERDSEIVMLKKSQYEAEELKGKLAELQKAVDQRAADDKEQLLTERFEKAAKGLRFVNDFTKSGVMNEFRAALDSEKNTELTDAEVLFSVTEGRDNLFEPDGGVPTVVSGSGFGFGDTPSDNDVRAIMGLDV